MSEETKKETTKTYYFLAGMPRSGSTLLSSILNQNPRIYSGPSSPVLGLMESVKNHIDGSELYKAFPKKEQRKELISSVIDHYYSDVDKPVVIDKNRGWSNLADFIKKYVSDSPPKIICMVRDIGEILTSFITLIRKNGQITDNKLNFIDADLVRSNLSLTDDNRCEILLKPNGACGMASNSLFKGLEKNKDNIHIIEYNNLINNTEEVMKGLYEFLGEEYYHHTYDNLVNVNKENDGETYGLPDLHTVRGKMEKTSSKPEDVLSEKILKMCRESSRISIS